MEVNYEMIKNDLNIPIKIFTHVVDKFPYHWHEETEILFILKGEVTIKIDENVNHLKEGDVFLVNRNELHFIQSTTEDVESQLLALQFNIEHFLDYNLNLTDTEFYLNSSIAYNRQKKSYDHVRYLLAKLMYIVINNEQPFTLSIEKYFIELMILLLNQFCDETEITHKDKKENNRMIEIIKYINQNAKDPNLGLSELSNIFHINSQYLSRVFKETMGITLKKFIDSTRLNKSLKILKTSNERIIDIALEHGFPDAKSYYRVFKEVLETTPNEYRNKNKIEIDEVANRNYFLVNSQETLSNIFGYLNLVTEFEVINKEQKSVVEININEIKYEIKKNYLNLLTFGYAPHGLRSDFKKQLHLIQQELKFKYIRFHGIFADQMLVYNETNGDYYFNFNHIDTLLDNIIEENLKPFIELGFMPSELSSTDDTLFWWKANVSPPNNINRWNELLKAFFKHIISRYGIEEVLTWKFEFWNEPEIINIFWAGSKEEFFEFFKSSYETIKGIDTRIQLGGFGNISVNFTHEWLKDFFSYSNQNDIQLDFHSFHIYPNVIDDSVDANHINNILRESINLDIFELINNDVILSLGEEDTFINEYKKYVEQYSTYGNDIPLYVTEWNSSTYSRDLVHDTCFMGPFIIKNILECHEGLEGMGFWTFTDLFEEFRLKQPLFHGGFGFLTYNGLKKPAYHAYSFLSKLGNNVIERTKDYIITKKSDSIQVLIFNYTHYNELYKRFDYSQISETNRYQVFEAGNIKNLVFKFNDLSGDYLVEEFIISRKHGSIFDAWVEMGAPEVINDNMYKALEHASFPKYKQKKVSIDENFTYFVQLEQHEFRFVEFKKIY